MDINRTVIAPYSAADMYALVDDIASYPDFLPWCSSAEVERSADSVCARLGIRYYGFSTAFATRNIHTPTGSIRMELTEGPLSALTGAWAFIPLDENRCRIEFTLYYKFSNTLMSAALSKIFSSIFDDFVDHFIQRAQTCYKKINVEIVQAADAGKSAQTVQLPRQATVADALKAVNMPYSDAVSVYGRLCGKDTVLSNGDRIELNMPLPQSPQQMRRRRQ